MQVTCEQVHLLKAVQIVGRAVSARTTMPILTHMLFETGKDSLKLAATDLEMGIQTTIPASIKRGGAITLPARLVMEIVANLPEAKVQIRVEENVPQAEIQCNDTTFEVLGMAATDFPSIPDPEATVVATVEAGLLRTMIRQTAFAVSTDETRPFLTGVFLSMENSEIRLVATDGGRLALRSATLSRAVGQKIAAIVPAKTMQELARALGGGSGDVTVTLTESHLLFSLPEIRLVSRLIAGQFPNYQQVIPEGHKQRLRLNTERFLQAVRRAAITARDSANVVRLSAKDTELIVTSNTPEVGKTVEKVPVQAEGEAIQVAFNAKYLIECLAIMETDEVVFELTGPLSPGALRPVGQQDYVYVLAPVRVYA